MDAKMEKFASLGGIWFVLLTIAGSVLIGQPPDTDASAKEVADYFLDKGDDILTSHVLFLLATAGLMWWFASLWRKMSAAENGNHRLSVLALVGFVWSGMFYVIGSAIWAAVALRIDSAGEDTEFFFTLGNVMFGAAALGNVAFMAAIVALTLRNKMFPAWTAYIAAASLAGSIFGVYGSGTDDSIYMMISNTAGYLFWMLWLLAVSFLIYRGEKAPASAAT